MTVSLRKNFNIEKRRPIWIALSNFYLDTELQDYDVKHITAKIRESPYSLEEVKQINKTEVFPILYQNLLSVAGVWTGFQEEWLTDEITNYLEKTTRIKRIVNRIVYAGFNGMFKDLWNRIEEEYSK